MNKMRLDFFSDHSKDEWETPREIFETLNKEFGFTLDPCCTSKNAKCEKFYTAQENGLLQDWSGEVVFLSPPRGRQTHKWIKKAYESSLKGATVVCLVFAKTDTIWWHSYCMKAKNIRFLRGRLKFILNGQSCGDAPFGSAVVVFQGKQAKVAELSLFDQEESA